MKVDFIALRHSPRLHALLFSTAPLVLQHLYHVMLAYIHVKHQHYVAFLAHQEVFVLEMELFLSVPWEHTAMGVQELIAPYVSQDSSAILHCSLALLDVLKRYILIKSDI